MFRAFVITVDPQEFPGGYSARLYTKCKDFDVSFGQGCTLDDPKPMVIVDFEDARGFKIQGGASLIAVLKSEADHKKWGDLALEYAVRWIADNKQLDLLKQILSRSFELGRERGVRETQENIRKAIGL